MNQQNSTADQEAAKAAEVESAAAAKKAAAEKAAAEKADAQDKAAKEAAGDQLVTLVHPATNAKVEVVKPSADYTNYVRGYGYQEA